MRRTASGRVALAVGAALTMAAGCTDRIPTLVDADRIPPGLAPTTIEYILETDAFFTSGTSVRGPTTIEDAQYFVVAGKFGGVLDAHVLAGFSLFPDSIDYSESDGTFGWVEGIVRSTVVDSLASDPELDFYLWLVEEPFDATATWENAISGPDSIVPWSQPGGPRVELLGIEHWSRSDTTAAADSLAWSIPTGLIARLAEEDVTPGFLVTMEGSGGQARIAPLSVDYRVTPFPAQDTILDFSLTPVVRRLLISEPPPPLPADAWSVGGLTSDWTLLRMTLPSVLPGCPTGDCPSVPATGVVLNRVDLLMEPVPVANGFRPVGPAPVSVRRVFDPQFGLQAPLGPVVSGYSVPAEGFFVPGGPEADFIITAAVAEALVAGKNDFGLALTMEPEASELSYAWFGRNPRLRFVYTLRKSPELP